MESNNSNGADTTYKCACMDATILVDYFCKLLSILQLKLAFLPVMNWSGDKVPTAANYDNVAVSYLLQCVAMLY